MTRPLIYLLSLLLLITQLRLWLGENGLVEYYQLSHRVQSQEADNQQLRLRNERLHAEVLDLKDGLDALEERARTELGMLGSGETFYWLIGQPERQLIWSPEPQE
ncbi:cell division protein FtsB [Marinospirillum sp. MEB164]|uniref:Cell division protein FtsB n=1 Tax=Marinospirillum alkalitolerans TaxID=3123374 RepID=A0ABW8PTD6_9GAMM